MKKIKLTLSIILLLTSSIFAQKVNIDSLKNVIINNPVDTLKIDAYIKTVNHFSNKNIDSAIYYAEKGVELCKSINHIKGKMILYQPYGIAYARKGDLQKAKELFQKGLYAAEQINETRSQINFLNNLAIIFSMLNKQDSSQLYLQKVLEKSLQTNNKRGVMAAYNNMGLHKQRQNLYYSAIAYYQKTINIADSINTTDEFTKRSAKNTKANAYINTGICFLELKSHNEAIKNYKKALYIYNSVGDSAGIGRSYANIGRAYVSIELADSAKLYINKSIDLANSVNNKLGIGTDYNNLGQAFFIEKDYDKSLEYRKKAIEAYSKSRPDKVHKAYYAIAEVYVQIGNYKEAESYLAKAIELTKNQYDLESIYVIYKELYEKKGNFKKALRYANLLAEVKDSLYNNKKLSLVQDLQTKYETEKKEADNVRLKTEVALQTAEVAALKSKQLLIVAVAILFILILLLFYYIKQKRQTDKLNKLKFTELGKNNNKTARDLHDGIGGYHSALKMMLENKTGLTKEINIIDDAQKALRFQLQKLKAPDVLDENFDFVNEIKTFVNFMKSTNEFDVNLEIANSENWKNIRYELKMHLYNILKELLTNTMKYAEASKVDISINHENNKLQFSYKDNGKGFDTNMQIKGEGINNIKLRAKQINALVDFNSTENEGTKLDLNIPLKKSFSLLRKVS